ncbi:MAG: 5'-methylthioadenosine/S-adenosylhomocysteine nucleosidase [Candidatus Scalindua sp.]|nr:5'-methylthioadenosine/S-adenosylhomocysteine nucleosidase [Candidatus Scalindua sp.]
MIAVLCALPQEINPLISRVNITKKFNFEKSIFHQADLNGLPVIFVQTGIGRSNAVKATNYLLQTLKITTLISSGVAGGIREGIHVGDLIIGENVCYCKQSGFEGERLPLESTLSCTGELVQLAVQLSNRLELRSHNGDVLTVDTVIGGAATKREIGRSTSFISVDMESAAIAEVAHANGIDFVVIRSVSDDVDDDLEIDYDNLITDTGKVKISHLAINILKNPQQLANLKRLNKQTKTATRILSVFLLQFLPLLYEKMVTPTNSS